MKFIDQTRRARLMLAVPVLFGIVLMQCPQTARAEGDGPLAAALAHTKPIVELRWRYERVTQDPPPALLTKDAVATTLRGRVGFETGKAWNTALLVEGEFVARMSDSYRADNAVAGVRVNYPVVADPTASELNRFQLTNTSLPATTVTLGRQRINLDDQRFVGNVGWRQNEQTFDALRVVNKSLPHLSFDATYFSKVHRIFGPDSPQGVYSGHGALANAAYQHGQHKLTAFAYLLDFDPIVLATGPGVTAGNAAALNPARASTSTYGLRATGEKTVAQVKLGYAVSWATQSDRGSNPLHLRNDYFLGEVSAGYRNWTITAGDERLQGDGTVGFSTPLATLHKFQGWADKFLVTPANGIDDRYVGVSALFKNVGPLATVTLSAAHHDYQTERLGLGYGSESNLLAAAKWKRCTGTLKYAHYVTGADSRAVAGLGDTGKFWAQIEFAW